MYSYEDRIRAVEHFIKSGRRLRATTLELGYPTEGALRKWCREYEERGDLPLGFQGTAMYSPGLKAAAVDHYANHGRCIAATRRALGYPSWARLQSWIRELRPDLCLHVPGSAGIHRHSLETKRAAVVELCAKQRSAGAIANEVGVARKTLYNWRDRLLRDEAPTSMKRPPKRPAAVKHKGPPETLEDLPAVVADLARLTVARDKTKEELVQAEEKLQQMRMEYDIMLKLRELIKKDLGVSEQLPTNREKMMLIDALKSSYPLPKLLAAFGLARSSYFYHRARRCLGDKYAEMRGLLADIFKRNRHCYGYRRMQVSLRESHVNLSEKVIRRLMKQENLIAVAAKRRHYSSYRGEISPAPENLINRDFHSKAPNQKWLTDITEFQIPAGKMYLSPIIDCFDGLVVSWTLGTSPDAELVNTMLDAAIKTLDDKSDRPIVHSDRGVHYRWPGWLSRMKAAGLTRSMSRKATSADNAACEGFFGRLKTELFYPGNWQSTTIEQFTAEVSSYLRWYNEERVKVSLGGRSPLQYRASLACAA